MTLRAFRAAFAASARERLRHPGDVLGFAVFLVLLLYTFTHLWRAAAASSGGAGLGGYAPAQLVLYLLVTELVTLAPGNLHVGISARVRSGDVVTDLLRPVDWIAWEIARGAGSAAVRVGVLAAAGVPALLVLGGVPRVDPRGLLVGLMVLAPLAILLDTAVRILIGLLAFWFEDSAPFYWIWQKLCFTLGGLMLPLDLFPEWLRTIAACLPFSAILFAPAHAVVAWDAGEASAALLKVTAWLAAALLALVLLFGRASRRLTLNGG